MPSRYHPIEDGLWDDQKFDACGDVPEAPGEERGFFAFLSSNKMQRPAGIYRATDEEIAAAARLPLKRVKAYLTDLDLRKLIVRDGAWLFCPGYWKRQAHNPGMVKAARVSVESCSSLRILRAFVERYPLHREWLPNGLPTVSEPSSEIAPTEQSRAEQSSTRAEQSKEPSVLVGSPPTQPELPVAEPATKETPDDLMAVWNEGVALSRTEHPDLKGLVRCSDMTGDRRAQTLRRLKEAELAWHRKAIMKLAKSSFACGRPSRDRETGELRKWRASIDWYVKNDGNCKKAYEGRYDD